jgi:hypothetical protein
MHIEKNICSALFKTITNSKGTKADSDAQQLEMERMGIMKDFWITEGQPQKQPIWIFTKKEYKDVVDVIKNLRTPRGYGSSFQYKFVDGKITGMKTHDYHNLLHHILPIAIRGTLTPDIRDIVYRLGKLFRWLCGKEIHESEIREMEEESTEIVCKMEQHLPPSFFDIMPHLIVHLVKEVELAGPVPYRWMYYLERYMKDLKGWVRQKARPEGSMTKGYILQEAMVHVTEYIARLDPKGTQLWNYKEDPEVSITKLPKVYKLRRLDRDPEGRIFLQQCHAFVLKNDPCLRHWREKYALLPSLDWTYFGEWIVHEMRALIHSGQHVPNREYHLGIGPHPKVKFFSHMWANGKYLRIASRDSGKATQDSGIAASFIQDGTRIDYYGKIENIVQVHFSSFNVTLLRGIWFNSEPKHARASAPLLVDECGFMRLKTLHNVMTSKRVVDEPFIYPSDIEQIFFVQDRLHQGWHLIVPYDPRAKRIYYKHQQPHTDATRYGENDCSNDNRSSDEDYHRTQPRYGAPEQVNLCEYILCRTLSIQILHLMLFENFHKFLSILIKLT